MAYSEEDAEIITRRLVDIDGIKEHTLLGVREHTEGYPVELRRDIETERLVITSWNEGHNNYTKVDLFDLIEWLRRGPPEGRTEGGGFQFPPPMRI